MSTLISKASLLLVPSVYEDGTLYNVLPSGNKAPDETGSHNGYDQTRADFTFSRGSNLAATRVNASGLIEKGRENLILQSDWDDVGTGTAPSGWTTYDPNFEAGEEPGQIRFNISGNRAYIFQNLSVSAGVYTFSVFVDSVTDASQNDDMIAVYGSVPKTFVCFSKDGEIIPINTPVEAGYRYSLTYNFTGSGTATFRVGAGVNGNDTADITLSRPQVEKGLVATDYIETGSTTATGGVLENTPRIDYSSGAGALLLEPQRTNSTAQSEYIGASGVGALNVTNNTSETTSPEGLYNATLIAEDTTTGYHRIGISHGSMSNATKTFSVFAKWAGGSGRKWLTMDNGPICYFDLENGTKGNVGANCTADIEDYGNGWYRCYFTHTSSSSGTLYVGTANVNGGPGNHLGNGEDAMYLYGVQAEDGASYPSSYVPTYGSAATRGADSCNSGGSAESINSVEGVLYAEIAGLSNDTARLSISDGTNNNNIYIELDSSNVNAVGRVGGSNQFALSSSQTITNNNKVAVKYKANDFALYVNGTEVATDTSGSTYSANTLTSIQFNRGDGGVLFYGNVKQVAVFNEALSDSELADLTS